MASWKEDNTLNKLRESEVKWKRELDPESNYFYVFKAKGYPDIMYLMDSVPMNQRFSVYTEEVGSKKFSTLESAKAFAEAHPISKEEQRLKYDVLL